MDNKKLQLQQYIGQHPILCKKIKYRQMYLSLIRVLCENNQKDILWKNSMIQLMKKKLLEDVDFLDLRIDPKKGICINGKNSFLNKYIFSKFRYSILTDCLFLNAFDNQDDGKAVLEAVCRVFPNYKKKLSLLFDCFYHVDMTVIKKHFPVMENVYKIISANRAFIAGPEKNIMVTANMSAGKSTLLNALVGKKVNKTQNDTCTAKIHYIYNKAGEDGFSCKLDHDLELDASLDILMEYNERNESQEIRVGTRFRSLQTIDAGVCFIDTPGVNSSKNSEHREMTARAISEIKCDLLIYLMNGESIGTDDDTRHLSAVSKNYHGNIIFLVNKLDSFKKNSDSVPETLAKVKDDLIKIGFKEPKVFPVSAYAAYLAKLSLFGEELTDDEKDDMEFRKRKLSRDEFRYDKYFDVPFQNTGEANEAEVLLRNSGILSLEKLIYN